MASIYYITEHTCQAQLHYPYRHLGIAVAALDNSIFSTLEENKDYWYEGKVYDTIAYSTYTITPEAFKRLEDTCTVYRHTRACKAKGIEKMNLDKWIKQERKSIQEQTEEKLYQQVFYNCTMRNIFDAAISSIPKNRHIEFLRACLMLSRHN